MAEKAASHDGNITMYDPVNGFVLAQSLEVALKNKTTLAVPYRL